MQQQEWFLVGEGVCLTIALVKDVSGSLAQVTVERRRVSHDLTLYLEQRRERGGNGEGGGSGERGGTGRVAEAGKEGKERR